MRRLLLCLVSIAGALSAPSAPVRASQPTSYLHAAEATARHLLALARDEGERGLSWPISNINPARATGIDSGAAGIGTFFLALYEHTRDSAHLVTAERAAAYAFSEARRRGPNGPDWLAGAAGIGEFSLQLYRVTGRAVHLENARWAADWLSTNAVREGDTMHWRFQGVPRIYTGRYHGAAGIGLFFLNLHAVTKDDAHVQVARAAGRWLRGHIVRFNAEAIGWKRLTTDADAYHGWCGGTTGIMEFLRRLAADTDDGTYRELYQQTAAGLVTQARRQATGHAWPYTSSAASTSLPVIFCHGASSTAVALYDAWQTVGDSRFLQAARLGADWTDAAALTGPQGRYWPHIHGWDQFETGYQTGVASVGHAFLRMYAADARDHYLATAEAAGAYLLRIADRPGEGQMRWINYTNPARADWPHEYLNGWYAGAAGIGIFLLELDSTLRAR